jgi:ATP-dependent RNA helicase SUPV3L1/SUV3
MTEIGFARAGDAWRWRGRRAHRPEPGKPASHAFAALADLKR